MSYASDNAAQELSDQGSDHGRKQSDFERMLEAFGYSEDSWAMESGNEQARVRWNWNNISRRLP